jgi:NAD(P)H-flavin reductase
MRNSDQNPCAGHDGCDPMLPLPYRVVERRQETRDTVTLALTSAGATPTASFLPGQFSMLYLFGVGEVPISISGDPRRVDRIVHTTRAVGAVSRAICALQPGDMVGFRGPFGSPWPMETSAGRDLVFVAGGIGLAPLRPAIYHAVHNRERYGRVHILVGARKPGELLFTDEYDHWRELGANVQVTVDAADEHWTGNVGVVPRLIPSLDLRTRRQVAMVCGPEIMMRFTAHALRDAGVADSDIHLTMERNMKCAIGLCGHCQYGADFICEDGPVFPLSRISGRLFIPEI